MGVETVGIAVAAPAIDEAWLLETLAGLVAIPSWKGDERAAQEYVAAVMDGLGMDLDVWEIDEAELSRHPDYATELERERPLGVVGRMDWGGRAGKGLTGSGSTGSGPTLVLNGHVDVVPPGDPSRWTAPPFCMDVRGGRVYGRGVLDMKGPLVAGLAGVKAVLDSGVGLRGSLLFQSVIGEEDGGLGTLASVLRGHTGDGAIVVEPTGLHVANAQAGALNFRLSVPGRAAHGALRHEGVSALEKFMLVYRHLMDFEGQRNACVGDPRFGSNPAPYAICIGTVRGGEWASSVPEVVRAEGRFGVGVREDVGTARRLLEAQVAECCARDDFLRDNPVGVEWWGGQFAPCETAEDARIVTVARSVARDLGVGTGGLAAVPYGSDLRHLVNAGSTPGVLFGPGDVANAHREDESIGVDELVDGARAVALAVMRFLGRQA
ncbi:MAG: ArgE/DapE family deacylase [Gemmatimonadetes bacterium]|nr:ArgE/DapE family deacylase [Gemmatimonadota bacterium]